jgi:hypothetical protein
MCQKILMNFVYCYELCPKLDWIAKSIPVLYWQTTKTCFDSSMSMALTNNSRTYFFQLWMSKKFFCSWMRNIFHWHVLKKSYWKTCQTPELMIFYSQTQLHREDLCIVLLYVSQWPVTPTMWWWRTNRKKIAITNSGPFLHVYFLKDFFQAEQE